MSTEHPPNNRRAGRAQSTGSREVFKRILLTGILVILFGFQIEAHGEIPPPEPVHDISVNPVSVDFVNINIDSSSDQIVTVSNEGNIDLTIGPITDPQAPFSILNDNCSGQTITPSTNCTLTVRFSPTTPGTFNDTFDIPYYNPDENIVSVCLSGSGIASGNNIPTKPDLIYPSNGSADMPTTLTLKWKKSTDPDGDTVTYKLHIRTAFTCVAPIVLSSISNNANYTVASVYPMGIIIGLFGIVTIGGFSRKRKKIGFFIVIVIFVGGLLFSSCGGGGSSDDGDTGDTGDSEDTISYKIQDLRTGTAYYWKVVADDGNGGVTESDTYSFTTAP